MAELPTVEEFELKIPANKTTWRDKLAFALTAREALRREHNAKGRQFRQGEITETAWNQYVVLHARKSGVTSKAINALKQTPPAADLAEVDLERDYREVTAVGD